MLLNYRCSVDSPFCFELYQKSYTGLKHRVTLRIYFYLVLWIKVGLKLIWLARSHIRNTFDHGVASNPISFQEAAILLVSTKDTNVRFPLAG